MTMEFYLFDVEQGQCAAVCLPNRKWCIFDVGRRASVSPVRWIVSQNTPSQDFLEQLFGPAQPFSFLKATISHLHGDHLADYRELLLRGIKFLRVGGLPGADRDYFLDLKSTVGGRAWSDVTDFLAQHGERFAATNNLPDYGVAEVTELSLSAAEARLIGGQANSRVNNTSIVSRINCYGYSILVCGDMEKEAWELVLNDRNYASSWIALVAKTNILVAPHHAHASGFSKTLMDIAEPDLVLASVASKDPSVDPGYSAVKGMTIGNKIHKLVTTRQMGGIHLTITQPSLFPLFSGKGQCFLNNLSPFKSKWVTDQNHAITFPPRELTPSRLVSRWTLDQERLCGRDLTRFE
jgi:hypothetical protein